MMMRKIWFALVIALLMATPILPVQAHAEDGYSIMVPEKGAASKAREPWLAPKYKSPHGTREHVKVPRFAPAPRRRAQVPPPIVVPETGRVLPNLPTISGAGPNGSESYQDRALRCTHQAGAYGSAATGDRGTYIRTCINQ
jgi:hypothetical protein